jgi:glycerol-3-phosphate dehydrogenase
LRGFSVSVVERGEISSGTSGRTHGLLHSGGRYCVKDPEAAVECITENNILRKIAFQCVVFNQGLFVALNEADMEYAPLFVEGATKCGISVEKITPQRALQMEPNLNPHLIDAYIVPDGTFDPFRLAMVFAATAKQNGARFFTYAEVTHLLQDGQGKISGISLWHRSTGAKEDIRGDIVINATGAWAGRIAKMAGVNVPVTPSPGVMVAFDQRLVQHTINRLYWPGDGDLLIPQRRMVVMGTTQFEVDDPDYIPLDPEQIREMVKRATELVPAIQRSGIRGTYMSARPLVGKAEAGRSMSRTFKCYNHRDQGIDGLVTITGGKATTSRVMAEKTADLVCTLLNINAACQTHLSPLTSYRNFYKN